MSSRRNKTKRTDDSVEEMNKRMKVDENALGILDLPDAFIGWIVSILDIWSRHNIRSTCRKMRDILRLYKRFVDSEEVGMVIKDNNWDVFTIFLLNPFSDLGCVQIEHFICGYSRPECSSAIAAVMTSKDTKWNNDTLMRTNFFQFLCGDKNPQSRTFAKNMIANGLVLNPNEGFLIGIRNGDLSMYELAHIRIPCTSIDFWKSMAETAYRHRLTFVFEDIVKRVPQILDDFLSYAWDDHILNECNLRIIVENLPDDTTTLRKWAEKAMFHSETELMANILSKPCAKRLFQELFVKSLGDGFVNIMEFLYKLSTDLFAWEHRLTGEKGGYIATSIIDKEILITSVKKNLHVIEALLKHQHFDINRIYSDIMVSFIEEKKFGQLKLVFEHPTVIDRMEGKLLRIACKHLFVNAIQLILDRKWETKRNDACSAFFNLCRANGRDCMILFRKCILREPAMFPRYGNEEETNQILITNWFRACLARRGWEEAIYVITKLSPFKVIYIDRDSMELISKSDSSVVVALLSFKDFDPMGHDAIIFTGVAEIAHTGSYNGLAMLLRDKRTKFSYPKPHKFIKRIFELDDTDLFSLIMEGGIYQKLKCMIPINVIFDLCIEYTSKKILKEFLNSVDFADVIEKHGNRSLDSLEEFITEDFFKEEIADSDMFKIIFKKYGLNKPWVEGLLKYLVEEEDIEMAYYILKYTKFGLDFGSGMYLFVKQIAKKHICEKSSDIEVRKFIGVIRDSIGCEHIFRMAARFGNDYLMKMVDGITGPNAQWSTTEKDFWLRQAAISGHFAMFRKIMDTFNPDPSVCANYLLRHCKNSTILKFLYSDARVINEFMEQRAEEYIIGMDRKIEEEDNKILSMYDE